MSRKRIKPNVRPSQELVEKIYAAIDASTIPQELKAVYMLANAVQIMTESTFRRIELIFLENGLEAHSNSLLHGIEEYCRMVRKAGRHFFDKIEPQIGGATFEIGRDASEGCELYDSFNQDCDELIRLMLLYIDRTRNTDRWRDVFAYLRRLPSTGTFNDEDFTRYKMKV